jgi:hypothetical protein
MELRFSPGELETTRVGRDRNSTTTLTRRKTTPKDAAIIGSDQSRCKAITQSSIRPRSSRSRKEAAIPCHQPPSFNTCRIHRNTSCPGLHHAKPRPNCSGHPDPLPPGILARTRGTPAGGGGPPLTSDFPSTSALHMAAHHPPWPPRMPAREGGDHPEQPCSSTPPAGKSTLQSRPSSAAPPPGVAQAVQPTVAQIGSGWPARRHLLPRHGRATAARGA